MNLQENIPLAPYTTLQIGGPARYFVVAETETDISEALEFASEKKLEVFVLGGGSNIVVSDTGFPGLVIQMAIKGVAYDAFEDTTLLTAGAGEDWDQIVKSAVNSGLAGIECMSGIPGQVGGTPVQNVGAYGQEVAESIETVRCLDRLTGQTVVLSNAQCGFSYRTSIFNSTERGRYIVLGVAFRLVRGGVPKVAYRDLVEKFSGEAPGLYEVRKAVIDIRRAKAMVIDADDPDSRSAGSFFKNPIVTRSQLEDLGERFPGMPSFTFGEDHKIPAAWLIEHAGFEKGYRLGNAGISTKHTLAIVNTGRALATDVAALKEIIQLRVLEQFGIGLEPEPIFVGFE